MGKKNKKNRNNFNGNINNTQIQSQNNQNMSPNNQRPENISVPGELKREDAQNQEVLLNELKGLLEALRDFTRIVETANKQDWTNAVKAIPEAVSAISQGLKDIKVLIEKDITNPLEDKLDELKKEVEKYKKQIQDRSTELNSLDEKIKKEAKEDAEKIEKEIKEEMGTISKDIKKSMEKVIGEEQEEQKKKIEGYKKGFEELESELGGYVNGYKQKLEANIIEFKKRVLSEKEEEIKKGLSAICLNQSNADENVNIKKINIQSEIDLKEEKEKVVNLQAELRKLRFENETLAGIREGERGLESLVGVYKKALKNCKDAAKQLEAEVNKIKGKSDGKGDPYTALVQIKKRNFDTPDNELNINDLDGLANHIYNYAGSTGLGDTKFHYSKDDIRAFLLGFFFKNTRLTILQGISGTGKSSLPQVFAKAIGAKCHLIPVQPNWRDRYEMLGYFNEFKNKFNATIFTKALYEASLDQRRIHIILLDEANLSRMEYYFADFISLMESGQSPFITLYDAKTVAGDEVFDKNRSEDGFLLTNNVFFVATINADETTSEISDKICDRANIIEMKRQNPANGYQNVDAGFYGYEHISELINANARDGVPEELRNVYTELMGKLNEIGLYYGKREYQVETYLKGFNNINGLDYFCSNKYLRKIRNLGIRQTDLNALSDFLQNQNLGISLSVLNEIRRELPE